MVMVNGVGGKRKHIQKFIRKEFIENIYTHLHPIRLPLPVSVPLHLLAFTIMKILRLKKRAKKKIRKERRKTSFTGNKKSCTLNSGFIVPPYKA